MSDKRWSKPDQVSRRNFLMSGGSGALLLGLGLDGQVLLAQSGQEQQPGLFNAFLKIRADGRIQITPPTAEMGQGAHTALPAILAEELEANWEDVEVLSSYANPDLASPLTGRQRTAASEGVKIYYEQLRQVGASAREMLCLAAANRWQVPVAECSAKKSRVFHSTSNRTAGFGELAGAAAKLPIPKSANKKSPGQFSLIGRPIVRKDLQDKVTGKAIFGIDVQAPDMLYASVRMAPSVRGTVIRFDPSSVSQLPGVTAAVEVDGGVAVIADSFWRAKKAAEALNVEFAVLDGQNVSSNEMGLAMRQLLTDDSAAVQFPNLDTRVTPPKFQALNRDVTEAALTRASQVLDLEYEVPYLAHLAMEPMVCTALVTADACHVWSPTQHPDGSRKVAAELTGLPLENVRLDVTYAGGGFGRKFELDVLRQTIQSAKAVVGRPVKLTWTREQDVQHDFYRPGFLVRTRVALTDNAIAGMHSRIAGQSIWRFQGKNQIPNTADPTAAALLIYDIYDFPAKYIDFVEAPWLLSVGLWRSVTLSQNAFFAESAIDEAAHAVAADPYLFRRQMLAAHPRIVAVLDRAADKAQWHRPRPPGQGLGIALSHGFGSICAQVIEVALDGDQLRIEQIVCAVDCGLQIDPDSIIAQLEGGMIFGLSAALRGEITFADGMVQQSNFHDQQILRFNETPHMLIELVDSEEPPGGIGEVAVPPVAPALANALFAAGGRRCRRLPLSSDGITLV
ncbi:MAG: molybdopterin cofactor-binding domain-containing protein [Lysobacterales bacterium]